MHIFAVSLVTLKKNCFRPRFSIFARLIYLQGIGIASSFGAHHDTLVCRLCYKQTNNFFKNVRKVINTTSVHCTVLQLCRKRDCLTFVVFQANEILKDKRSLNNNMYSCIASPSKNITCFQHYVKSSKMLHENRIQKTTNQKWL